MATLIPASRPLNLEKSINDYVRTNLVGAHVKLMGQPLGVAGDEWVEINQFALFNDTEMGHVGGGATGGRGQWQVDLNCFVRNTHNRTTIYDLSILCQRAEELFAIHAIIPIIDYDTVGFPVVNFFQVLSTQKFPVPVNPGMRVDQVNVSTVLTYNYAAIV